MERHPLIIVLSIFILFCFGCNDEELLSGSPPLIEPPSSDSQLCEENTYDLNETISDGCEYECVFQSSIDEPDSSFRDSNCDGIDGYRKKAVFVSSEIGSDLATGQIDSPLKSINKAISVALENSLNHVYIAEGTYIEEVNLKNSISLYGGYSQNWTRSTNLPTIITSEYLAMTGTEILNPTVIMGLIIRATNPEPSTKNSKSIYGIHCNQCPGLQLIQNTIQAASANSGMSGTRGLNGSNGKDGGNGAEGSCKEQLFVAGGVGAEVSSNRGGGMGGIGGYLSHGTQGSTSVAGTVGGTGGTLPGGNGENGFDGANGAQGGPAQLAAGGSIINSHWKTKDGFNGFDGTPGAGGGGGGGGAGNFCFHCNSGTGNGGGGGGSGGEQGFAGKGGYGGGGSFGVFLLDSEGAILSDNTISSSTGGAGGIGARGGVGGSGGSGGKGGNTCTQTVGRGGNGGKGGIGGSGSSGSGGAGGPSIALFLVRSSSAYVIGANLLLVGQGGLGGLSEGGISGVSGISRGAFLVD